MPTLDPETKTIIEDLLVELCFDVEWGIGEPEYPDNEEMIAAIWNACAFLASRGYAIRDKTIKRVRKKIRTYLDTPAASARLH